MDHTHNEGAPVGAVRLDGAELAASLRTVIRRVLPQTRATIDRVASVAGFSTRSFQRHLARSGLTFSDELYRCQLELAVELLRGDYAITLIGYEVGYSNSGSFSRAFRAWTGMSPRAYRQLQQYRRLRRT